MRKGVHGIDKTGAESPFIFAALFGSVMPLAVSLTRLRMIKPHTDIARDVLPEVDHRVPCAVIYQLTGKMLMLRDRNPLGRDHHRVHVSMPNGTGTKP